MTTGERIKRARKAAGLTQQELGELLGVSGSMIGQYESNLRKPKHETLLKIAKALKVMPYELYSEISWVYHNADFAEKVGKSFGLLKSFLDDNETPPNIRDAIQEDLPDLEKVFEDLPDLTAVITAAAIFKAIEKPNQLQEQLLSLFESLNDKGKAAAIERVLELTEIPRYQHSSDASASSDRPEDK